MLEIFRICITLDVRTLDMLDVLNLTKNTQRVQTFIKAIYIRILACFSEAKWLNRQLIEKSGTFDVFLSRQRSGLLSTFNVISVGQRPFF